jgi:hypothetical protein
MKYSVLDFNGVAVWGHISVSLKTDFSCLQSIPTGAGVTQPSMHWVSGGATHPGREADHSPSTGQRARRSE